MGLLDAFRRKKESEAPPPPAIPITTPTKGNISAFSATDGVGLVALSDGSTLKFGASSCLRFDPVERADVVINEAKAHPLGGFRATEIVLDPDSTNYDDLLAARDRDLGVTREPLTDVEQAAATCDTIGWITILVNEPPPTRGPQAFERWAKSMGLPQKGIRVSSRGDFRLGVGAHEALLYLGDAPYPADKLRDYGIPPDVDSGRGFVGMSLGLPGMMTVQRLTLGHHPDPWAPDGTLRNLSRIAKALLENGTGVILNVAGTFRTADRFVQLLGDLDDPELKPFGAWLGWSLDPEMRLYTSYGMGLQGLPDLGIGVDPDDRWSLDRGLEAIQCACHRMTWENRELADGEVLEVPVGVAVAAARLPDANEDREIYQVNVLTRDDGHHSIQLVPKGDPLGTRGLWRLASDPDTPDAEKIHAKTYARLLQTGLYDHLGVYKLTSLTPEVEPDTPAFEVEVLEAEDGEGFFMATIGVGRKRQAGGEIGHGTAHIELVAAMGVHDSLLASAIGIVGSSIHQHDGGDNVFKAGDTVGFQLPEIGAEGFVLADAGQIEMAGGAPIQLLEMVPLSSDEYERVRNFGSEDWLERLPPMSPATRAERWKLRYT